MGLSYYSLRPLLSIANVNVSRHIFVIVFGGSNEFLMREGSKFIFVKKIIFVLGYMF
jgi:hypothetical protein